MLTNILLSIVIILIINIIKLSKEKTELLLLIPFIISTNFFGFLPYSFFRIRGLVQQEDIVLIITLLIFVYVYFNFKPIYSYNNFLIGYKKIVYIFILFLIINLFHSFIIYGNFISSFKVFRIFFRYISILFFLNIILRLGKIKLDNLLKYIDVITLVLSILYILNFGFGITIFAVKSYQEDVYYNTLIYRNFYAFPIFVFFVLSRSLILDKFNIHSSLKIIILLIAILLVYTRTYLFVAFLIIISTLLIRVLKFKYYFFNIKSILSILFLIIIGYILVNVIFHNQYEYFRSRIDEVILVGNVYEVSNFKLRTDLIMSRIKKTININPIFGLGFIREDVSSRFYPDLFIRRNDIPGTILVGDQSWGGVIASLGLGGTVIFLLLYFYPLLYIRKWKLYKKTDMAFWAIVITLFCEIFIIGIISTNLIDEIFKLSFYFSLLVFYCIDNKLNHSIRC